MSLVQVSFESANLAKTVSFIRDNLLEDIESRYRPFVEFYLIKQLKELLLESFPPTQTVHFEDIMKLFHIPIQGVVCIYSPGDTPVEPANTFTMKMPGKAFEGNLIAYLYVHLN